ncbi:DUF488 family protein [uncultured Cellulomonas sp.]|uniref:DUF488 domain-containing protein n=1 Tax=uncultured Cellulomonas sp. TaxID=189682 RepID=UPI002614635A|nr:DUF488 domain-containing protein [uncultured Cellulomonas sp.]
MPPTLPTLLTFGHGTADADRMLELLHVAGVTRLVDVRRFPGSRRHPHVARDALEEWLPAGGVAYRWEPRLGGRRRVERSPDEPAADPWWQVEAFRAYAAHTRTPEFRDAMADLLADLLAELPADLPSGAAPPRGRTAVMCSETLWWRCHRRLVSDVAELLHGTPVEHLGHDGRLTAHRPADGARVTPDGLRYDLVAGS